MGNGDELKADIPGYAAGGAANTPPPPITPVPIAAPGSLMDALIAVLGAATNADVPTDNTAGQAGYAEREQKLNEAMTKFPANEEQSAAQLAAVGDPNQMLQMAQQVPQMASGIAQGMTGALSGVTQPLNQIPQQLSQVGQQAMQMGMGALQHGGGAAAAESVPAELLGVGGGLGGAGTDLAGAGGGGGAAGLGGTTPAAMLGPPPAPSASTVPMSSPSTPVAPTSTPEPATAPRGGMGAMPMVPPGGMHGAGGTGKDEKPDTKRVVAPTVKNGGPVQGRIVSEAPPTLIGATKRVEGKPVVSKRILLPDVTPDGDGADDTR